MVKTHSKQIITLLTAAILLAPQVPFCAVADISREALAPRSQTDAVFKALQSKPTTGEQEQTAADDPFPSARPEVVAALRAAIAEKGGRITFRDFMDISLYLRAGPGKGGFYTSGTVRISPDAFAVGNFSTAPERFSPDFGAAILKQIYRMWINLGCPEDFRIVEMGAGNGTLARDILIVAERYPSDFYKALTYTIVEVSPELIHRQKTGNLKDCLKKVAWIQGSAVDVPLGEMENAVFISNELPDTFPVHRVKVVDGILKEAYVTYRDNVFREEWRALSSPEVEEYVKKICALEGIPFPSGLTVDGAGFEIAVNLDALKWQNNIARSLNKGYIITIDYSLPDGSFGTYKKFLAGYKQKGAMIRCPTGPVGEVSDAYQFAGGVDITADVYFPLLVHEGLRAGLAAETLLEQDAYFRALGARNVKLDRNIIPHDLVYVLIQSKGVTGSIFEGEPPPPSYLLAIGMGERPAEKVPLKGAPEGPQPVKPSPGDIERYTDILLQYKHHTVDYEKIRTLPLEKIFDYMEVYAFLRCRRLLLEDQETTQGLLERPEAELKATFARYLAALERIEKEWGRPIDEKVLSPVELFQRLQDIGRIKAFIGERAGQLLYLYALCGADDRYRKFDMSHGPWKMENIMREVFEENRDLQAVFADRLMTGVYDLLTDAEPRLKGELRDRIEKDPAALRRIIMAVHQQTSDIVNALVDWLLQLRTGGEEPYMDEVLERYAGEQPFYQGTPYGMIRDLLKRIDLGPGDVFYDLGAGYGRVVLYTAMTTGVGRAVGIELVSERAAACNRVKDALALRNVEFRSGNVRTQDLSDGTVFFLFNPFSRPTLEAVGEKLREVAAGKKITIVSWGRSNGYFSAQDTWLKETRHVGKMIVYESTLHDPRAFMPLRKPSVNERKEIADEYDPAA